MIKILHFASLLITSPVAEVCRPDLPICTPVIANVILLEFQLQDPNGGGGPIPDNYTGVLQPGWLTVQWLKISNLTAPSAPYYTAAAAAATGGGFGLG
jgi:hypothetical protein